MRFRMVCPVCRTVVTETGFPHIWPLNGEKGEKSGRPGYGKADCDSGPCAALLPCLMVDPETYRADFKPFARRSAQ